MVNAIGSQGQNVHTLTLEGLDELVEKGHLQAHIRPALNAKLIHRTAYEDEPCTQGEGQIFTIPPELSSASTYAWPNLAAMVRGRR